MMQTNRRTLIRNRSTAISCGIILVGLANLMSTANAVDAAEQGFYAGVRYGQSDFDNSELVQRWGKIASMRMTREWTDKSSQSLSLNLGYQLNRNVAFEANYCDFGEGQVNETLVENNLDLVRPGYASSITEYIGTRVDAKGYSIGVVGSIPWKNWKFSAKLDGLYSKVTVNGTGIKITQPGSYPPGQTSTTSTVTMLESPSNKKVMYGASVSYVWNNHYRVEVDWRHAGGLGDQTRNGGLDVDILALGLHYHL